MQKMRNLDFDPAAAAFQAIADLIQPLRSSHPEQYRKLVQHVIDGATQLQHLGTEVTAMCDEYNFLVTRLTPTPDNVIRFLKERGFAPERIVDCGAFEGKWTQTFADAFPDARILMIDALREKEDALKSVRDRFGERVEYEITVLGDADGESRTFYEFEACSSLYDWIPSRSNSVERKTETLKTVLERHPEFVEQGIDLLKIDLEGYEKAVLETVEDLLPRVGVIFAEVHVIPVDSACALMGELGVWLEDRGYRFFDLCTTARQKDGMLHFADFAFIRKDHPCVPEFTRPVAEYTAEVYRQTE